MQIQISLSDPWDLGEAIHWQPVPGRLLKTIHDQHGGRAIVELDEPIEYRGVTYRYLLARPRHEGFTVKELSLPKRGAVRSGKARALRRMSMLKGTGFETMIASPPDYNDLVAEIYYDGLFVALVSQERGKGLFEIETPGPTLIEEQVVRKVDANGFKKALDEACRRLKGAQR